MEEPPSKCAVLYQRTVGRFITFKALLTVVTLLWLGQSFLWGGMYTGCGLVVTVSVAVMAGLIAREYLVHGSMVSRLVSAWVGAGALGGRGGEGHGHIASPELPDNYTSSTRWVVVVGVPR